MSISITFNITRVRVMVFTAKPTKRLRMLFFAVFKGMPNFLAMITLCHIESVENFTTIKENKKFITQHVNCMTDFRSNLQGSGVCAVTIFMGNFLEKNYFNKFFFVSTCIFEDSFDTIISNKDILYKFSPHTFTIILNTVIKQQFIDSSDSDFGKLFFLRKFYFVVS